MRRAVVIPWRGFRCFTLGAYEAPMMALDEWLQVVIPWRGFRCFTRYGSVFRIYRKEDGSGCNPLAGI